MQITVNLPDDIGRQIQQLPDAEGFVSTLLKQALKNMPGLPAKESGDPEKIIEELPGCMGNEPAGEFPDQAGESPACEAETGQMTLGEIMDKAKSVLRELADNAGTIMAELEPVRRSGFLEVMNRLEDRIGKIGNADDLVGIANIVYGLTLEIPCFPPDDEPREQYFRLKPAHDGNGYQQHVREQKAALEEVFHPYFERIEQAWRELPRPVPPNASIGSKETPWDIMGIFRDDPTWGEIFDEIERERDKDSIWLGGEAE